MGRFLKALVMTLLIMEVTAIVALTAVWTILSELQANQIFINIALGLSAAGLCVFTVVVFRRALAAEHRLEGDVEAEFVEWAVAPAPPVVRQAINAIGPLQARPLQAPGTLPPHRHVN
ncbi:MAG: hypothetical protein KKC43_01230 [Alphaproteobacteria bacterium]|nr:hypothetical protein [Alphaproteobacteria bacterium]